MAAPGRSVFFPESLSELFSLWNNFPAATLCSGGTSFMREGLSEDHKLGKHVISLDKIEEMHNISRTERYLEIGAAVKLSRIEGLGKIVPQALTHCITQIACFQVRNQGSIGGNICFPSQRLDTHVPMIALDAQYELRTADSSRWVSSLRFSGLAEGELLWRIRIPLEPWSFTSYRKFRPPANQGCGGAALFIMHNEKDVLNSIRVVYLSGVPMREKEGENMLSGKRLPIDRKSADTFIEKWKSYLAGSESLNADIDGELKKVQMINFIKTLLHHITN